MIARTKHEAFVAEVQAMSQLQRNIVGEAYFTAREWGLDASDAVDVARVVAKTRCANLPRPS